MNDVFWRQICEDAETGIGLGISFYLGIIKGKEPVPFPDCLTVFDIKC